MSLILPELSAPTIQLLSYIIFCVIITFAFIISNRSIKQHIKLHEQRIIKDSKVIVDFIQGLQPKGRDDLEKVQFFTEEIHELKEELRQDRLRRLRYTDMNIQYLAYLVKTIDKDKLKNVGLYELWEQEGQDMYAMIMEELKHLSLELFGEKRYGLPIKIMLDEYIRRMNFEYNKKVIFVSNCDHKEVALIDHANILLTIAKYAIFNNAESIVLYNDYLQIPLLPYPIIKRIKTAALLSNLDLTITGDTIKIGFLCEEELANAGSAV